MTIPLSLLVAHFIGDFVLQSDWMALNKSKSWWALYVHAVIYTLTVLPVLAFYGADPYYAVGLTFITHFATDAITSRITSRLWFFQRAELLDPTLAGLQVARKDYDLYVPVGGSRHWFFVMIGLDQLIHFGTLAWTLKLLSVL